MSPEEQTRRLEGRIERRPQDLEALADGPEVLQPLVRLLRARDEMFAASDTEWAPWCVARSDDKKRIRLNVIAHLLSRRLPTKAVKRETVKLPKRQIVSYKAAKHPLVEGTLLITHRAATRCRPA